MRLPASTIIASAVILGRTSRILPSSISTSACAKSPTWRSSVSTTPPLSRARRAPCTRASSASELALPLPWASVWPDTCSCDAAPPAAMPAPALRNWRREVPPAADASSHMNAPGAAGAVGLHHWHIVLLQRLDAHDPALVVDVPDRHGIGGVVDPGFAVNAVGLGQHIFRPLLGLR